MIAGINIEGWQAAGGLAVILLGWGLKYFQEFLKDRRDRESDKAKLEALQEIARSNSNIREGQIEQNGKLSTVSEINKNFHAEIIRAMKENCRASCPLK